MIRMEENREHFDKCGLFHFIHATFTQFTRFSIAWALSIMMFGNYDPGWKCRRFKSSLNSSSTGSIVHPLAFNATNVSYIIAQGDAGIPDDNDDVRQSFIDETSPMNGSNNNDGDRCDYFHECDVIWFDPSSSTIVTEFQLVCDQAYVPSVIISVQMAGMLLGSYVTGQLGELYGRKLVLYGSTALSSVTCFLAIFSTSWEIYAFFLFFIGFGGGGIMVLHVTYSMEFLESKWRARLMGIPTYNVSLGFFVVAIFLIRDWRYVHAATSILCGVACVGFFWSPESLRWLLIHGREGKASSVIDQINRVNKRNLDLESVKEQLNSKAIGDSIDDEKRTARKYTYLDLFRTPGIRSTVLRASVVWFFTIMSYYALTFSVKSLAGDFYVNALIAGLSEIPAVMAVSPIASKLGRRLAVVIFTSVGSLSYVIVVVIYYTASGDVAEYVATYSAFVAKGSAVATVNALNILSVELFPTAVRNVGVAFVTSVSRVGAIMAPYLIPRDQFSLTIVFIILGVASILDVALVISFPETKNESLRDSLTKNDDS